MREILIYVHGKGGSAEEVDHYKPLFPNCEVIGFDYRSQTPWEAKEEFPVFFAQQRQRCDRLTLIAGSIGAFFSMSALDKTLVDRAYFVSPVVDMENLIGNMMQWSNVTEQALAEKREIATDFGETLSFLGVSLLCAQAPYQNKNERTMECGRNHIHRRGKNNHDGKCSVFYARGSAVDLDGTADRLSLCAASNPQG